MELNIPEYSTAFVSCKLHKDNKPYTWYLLISYQNSRQKYTTWNSSKHSSHVSALISSATGWIGSYDCMWETELSRFGMFCFTTCIPETINAFISCICIQIRLQVAFFLFQIQVYLATHMKYNEATKEIIILYKPLRLIPRIT